MKRSQVLSSGVIISQDFADAIRPVFYQTEYEEFWYASDGGTLFLVRFRGRDYGVTCRHVFTGSGFEANWLFITQEKQAQKGSMPAPIKGIAYPTSPRDAAVGGDLPDLCVIEFDDDMPSDFFKGSAYIIDDKTVATQRDSRRTGFRGASRHCRGPARIAQETGDFRETGARCFISL